jgi:SAM-dependent methyltransferase
MPKNAIAAEALARELVAAGIVSATLSAPRTAAPHRIDKVRIHRVAASGDAKYQIEEFHGAQTFHRNVDARELEAELTASLGAAFSRAEFTTETGTVIVMANRRGELSAIRKPRGNTAPAKKTTHATDEDSTRAAVIETAAAHNRVKNYILAEGIPVPFLVDLGVMTADGSVVKSRYDKFRQINRFLEFIADVTPELERAQEEHPETDLTIVDFGCGKSYLTFAVYHYLARMRGIRARIVGLDLKKDVIEHCAGLAERYGYEKLSFAVGDIADYTGTDNADMVITLHACDTATDLALAQAVRWNSRVILSVPCCQHELNAQLAARETPAAQAGASSRGVLDAAFRHGIIRERMAALLTDAMRAELLETEGYRVQILEFIDMSHTPKNLLIRAIRRGDRSNKNAETRSSTADESRAKAKNRYESLRDFLGAEPTLERELANGSNGEQ